jgi:hypothetical protein
MKTQAYSLFAAVLLAAVCLIPAGCQTVPNPSPAQGAALERVLVSTAATLALNKNPQYIPAATALYLGIDAAVAQESAITPENIAAFVHRICSIHGVTPADEAIFTNLAQSVYQVYSATYKPAVVSSADPQVLLYVGAFRDGLHDAVAAVSAAPPRG